MIKRLAFLLSIVALAWFFWSTKEWPFMGDSTYMHYVVFLTKHGMAPYRDIIEINMPFAYLTEHMAMAVFGGGAFGWRIFDFSLIVVAVWSCCTLLERQPLAAVFASVLFVFVHGQDGVMMAGERDFLVAVFECAALAFLKKSGFLENENEREHLTQGRLAWVFGYGFLSSSAIMLKPPAALFLAVTLFWLLTRRNHGGSRIVKDRISLAAVFAGVSLPLLISVVYLIRNRAFQAFVSTVTGLIRLHSQTERKSFSFLLSHAFSPILALCLMYVLVEILWRGRPRSPVEPILALCAAAGWLFYYAQGKGFSYQRYPFLIFLIPLMSSVFFTAVDKASGLVVRSLSYAALIFGVGMMFFFDHRMATYSHMNPFISLSADLQSLGGASLSGSVQCMDTAGGCIAALYNEQLVQSTGFIYDCYFQDEGNSVTQDLRLRFQTAIARNPPRLLIITDSVCFGGKRTFDKFKSWPWFDMELSGQYHLVRGRQANQPVHYWSRNDLPFSYRVYEKNTP